MAQSLSLSLQQTQRLDMSQVQVIEMMTLSTEELEEKIKREAADNPVIALKDRDSSFEDYSSRRGSHTKGYADEANVGDYDGDDSPWMERVVGEKESLEEHLMSELGCLELDENVRRTAEAVISSLDAYGFTGPNPEEAIRESDREYLKDAIKAVQSLEPTGVGAKDWKGAIMLQLKEIEHDEDELRRYHDIIYRGGDYITEKRYDQLAKALKISRADLDAMLEVLKGLTPYPGLKYTSDYTAFAIPEISIKAKEGSLVLSIPRLSIPEVELDEEYLEMGRLLKENRSGDKEKEASRFLSEKINAAKGLQNLLKLRENTLEKIGTVLMEKQTDFFLKGPMFLKGLTMTETAEIMEVSISTISKLAQAKYVDTDWGILPLRYFFSTDVKTDSGDDLSRNSVKLMIKKLIDENDTGKKLSDQKISDKLAAQGIQVARRTVSKYRMELEAEGKL